MATRRWRGAGDEGAAGVAAPAIALRALILLAPAMFSGTVLAEFALARTAGRTQLEATVCVAPSVARVAPEYCDRVLRIPKRGSARRSPRACAPATRRRTSWWCSTRTRYGRPGALTELPRPFADPSVGGVTPPQAVFEPGGDAVRRLADWIEDVRYHLLVPPQAMFGQVGCPAGRT